MIVASFGKARDARTLSSNDWTRHAERRRAGGIEFAPGKTTTPVGPRSVEADFRLLSAMLRWACTVPTHGGAGRWLDRNPLSGIRCAREKNPKRPIATLDRFQATRRALRKLVDQAANDTERRVWVMVEFALVLAEATGRRESSVRSLRWEDLQTEPPAIRWRADADKLGVEWTVPTTNRLATEVQEFRRLLRAPESGLVFPSMRSPNHPLGRTWFDDHLERAERAAGLPKLARGLWHPYRRKWATERKYHPIKDVAAAGGWTSVQTLLTCYQQPDVETLRRVMEEPRTPERPGAGGLMGSAAPFEEAAVVEEKRRKKRELVLLQ